MTDVLANARTVGAGFYKRSGPGEIPTPGIEYDPDDVRARLNEYAAVLEEIVNRAPGAPPINYVDVLGLIGDGREMIGELIANRRRMSRAEVGGPLEGFSPPDENENDVVVRVNILEVAAWTAGGLAGIRGLQILARRLVGAARLDRFAKTRLRPTKRFDRIESYALEVEIQQAMFETAAYVFAKIVERDIGVRTGRLRASFTVRAPSGIYAPLELQAKWYYFVHNWRTGFHTRAFEQAFGPLVQTPSVLPEIVDKVRNMKWIPER